jgi:hypothetical protein
MGYIVNFTVILYEIFRATSGNVSGEDALLAIDRHVSSGRRDGIHREIRSFVTETFGIRFTVRKDLVLERTIELIRRHCVFPPGDN